MNKRRVRIEVTAEDIKNGARCKSTKCPIALATMRALGINQIHVDDVLSVHGDVDYVDEQGDLCHGILPEDLICELPKRATKWWENFDDLSDREMPVRPCSFWIQVDADRFPEPEKVVAATREELGLYVPDDNLPESAPQAEVTV